MEERAKNYLMLGTKKVAVDVEAEPIPQPLGEPAVVDPNATAR